MLHAANLNERQKAFVPVDGCAQNTLLLDTVINRYRKQHRSLAVVGIDLAKAFDSVSIHSIDRALKRFGFEDQLSAYIINAYSGATTTIRCGPVTIPGVKLLRGVKQGDPLSPLLFNLVMDELLDTLPKNIGCSIGDAKINSLAFADDLILLAETKVGMNLLLQKMCCFFKERNMKVNAKKCFSLLTTTSVKDRCPITIMTPTFHLDGVQIKPVGYDTSFKYLGIRFNPHGKMKPNIDELELLLSRLKQAPLKPQQKILLLRENLITRLNHKLVLGRITKGLTTNFDTKIWMFTKELLSLPNDTPTAYFYTPVTNGGLGLPCLSATTPLSLLRRIKKMELHCDDLAIHDLFHTDEMARLSEQCMKILGITDAVALESFNHRADFTNDLFSTIDGSQLAAAINNSSGMKPMAYHT